MTANRKRLPGFIILLLLLLAGFATPALAAEKPELRVTISLDIPPYVMDKADSGLEIDILRQALEGYRLQFTQLPYEQLQTAVPEKLADVSVGVQADDSGVNYSIDFITFANFAISKKADAVKIDKVADLRNFQVLTWENAYLELGDKFETLFSPQSPLRKNYIEVADQKEQVRMFWEGQGRVIVIDYSIFVYFSRELGHDVNEASFHAIFKPVTNFKAGFRDADLRDRFNQAVKAMCKDGSYTELMRRYGIEIGQSVCE